MVKPRPRRRVQRFIQPKDCFFCVGGLDPDYKEIEPLGRFMTDRGKIVPRSRSGLCARHQRALARQIKRARFLALLPFLAKVR